MQTDCVHESDFVGVTGIISIMGVLYKSLQLAVFRNKGPDHRGVMIFTNRAKHIIIMTFLNILGTLLHAKDEVPLVDQYTNADYGYSVPIPERSRIRRSDPLAPNHGFGIDLSETPPSYLWVDGTFYSEDFTVPEVPQVTIRGLQYRGAVNIKLRKAFSTRLGSLSAMHFIIDYKLKEQPMVSETIWALRPAQKDSSAIHYSIVLECARERFNQDSQVVEKLRQGWRLLPR
jgi:hypothetical protein